MHNPYLQPLTDRNHRLLDHRHLALNQLADQLGPCFGCYHAVYYRNGWSSTGVDLFEWSAEIANQSGLNALACRLSLTVCLLLYYTGRLQASIELANRLLAENETLNDPDIALTACTEIMLALFQLNQIQNAQEYVETVLRYIDQATIPTIRIRAYTVLGGFMMQTGQLDEAAAYQQKSLELAQQIEHRGYEAMALGNLGIAIGFSNPDKAAECFRAALAINEAMGDVQGMISGYSNLAIYGRVKGDRQLQETCLQRSIELAEQAHNDSGMAIIKRELGAAYYEWGDYQQSITAYQSALTYWKKQGAPSSQAVMLTRIGHCYRQLQQPERAHNTYRQAALLIIQAEKVNLLVDVVIGLADLQPDPLLAAEWICAARHCMSQLAPLDYLEPYIQPVEAQLKAQVSDAVFARAKERGVALDLQTIVRDELLLTV